MKCVPEPFAPRPRAAIHICFSLLFFACWTSAGLASAQSSLLDQSFAPPSGLSGAINHLVVHDNGKITIGGEFQVSSEDGRGYALLARLRADGKVDREFATTAEREASGGVLSRITSLARDVSDRQLVVINRSVFLRLGINGWSIMPPTRLSPARGSVFALPLENGGWLSGGIGGFYQLTPDGEEDSGFASYSVVIWPEDVALQPDGRILAADNRNVLRLETNGVLDLSYESPIETNWVNNLLEPLPDRRCLVAQAVTNSSRLVLARVIRLLENGAIDPAFRSPILEGGVIHALLAQRNGRVLAGGGFTNVGGGFPRNALIRLNGDGAMDETFDLGSGPNGPVHCLALQADGKVIVGGRFTEILGLPRASIARLNADPSSMETFVQFASNLHGDEKTGRVYCALLRSGNLERFTSVRVLIGGTNDTATAGEDFVLDEERVVFQPGESRRFFPVRILDDALREGAESVSLRLVVDDHATVAVTRSASLRIMDNEMPGSVDINFQARDNLFYREEYTVSGLRVRALASLPDGRILIGANLYQTNGLFALNSNGGPDLGSFQDRYHLFEPRGEIRALSVEPNGSIVVGGSFSFASAAPPGLGTNHLVRFGLDGNIDPAFDADFAGNPSLSGLHALARLPNGQYFAAGNFQIASNPASTRFQLVRLNSNGAVDPAFKPLTNLPVTAYAVAARSPDEPVTVGVQFRNRQRGDARCLLIQEDGRVIAGGDFTEFSGVTWTNSLLRVALNGVSDPEFRAQVNGTVYACAPFSRGQFLIAGDFTRVNGVARRSVALMNADGSLDETFDPGLGADDAVRAILVLPDGKVLIGGDFTTFDGHVCNGLARLYGIENPGKIEFAAPHFEAHEIGRSLVVRVRRVEGSLGAASAIVRLSEGSARAGADYGTNNLHVSFADGETGLKLVRIPIAFDGTLEGNETIQLTLANPGGGAELGLARSAVAVIRDEQPGKIDPAFDPGPGPGDAVLSLALQTDGKALAGGFFTSVGSVSQHYFTRFNRDGKLDTNYAGGLQPIRDYVWAIAVQRDGKCLVGARITGTNNVQRLTVTRFLPSGERDASFNAPSLSWDLINSIAELSDGKILVVGTHGWIRLRADGTTDATGDQFDRRVLRAIAVQPDGKYLFGGEGTNIARFNPDGKRDYAFRAPLAGFDEGIHSMLALPDGKILIGGARMRTQSGVASRILRLNSNGALDTSFHLAEEPNDLVKTMARLPDGRIMIGGWFTQLGSAVARHLAVLLPNGQRDTNFTTSVSGDFVHAIQVAESGEVFIGGRFSSVGAGQPRRNIARLLGVANHAPSVTISLPLPDFEFAAGAPIVLAADASDRDGFISEISFWSSSGRLGAITDPWQPFTVPSLPAGEYEVTARAVDDAGAIAVSAPVRFKVAAPPLRLDSAPRIVGGGVEISLPVEAGAIYVLQASEDLVQWQSVTTNTVFASPMVLRHPLSPETPYQFYRVQRR